MALHPPEHCVVHPLPLVPQFVGREAELDSTANALARRHPRRGRTRRSGRGRQDRHRGAISRRAQPRGRAHAAGGPLRVEFLSGTRCRVLLAGIAPLFHRLATSLRRRPKGQGSCIFFVTRSNPAERTCWCSTGWNACNDKRAALPAFLDRSKILCSRASCAESPTGSDRRSPW